MPYFSKRRENPKRKEERKRKGKERRGEAQKLLRMDEIVHPHGYKFRLTRFNFSYNHHRPFSFFTKPLKIT